MSDRLTSDPLVSDPSGLNASEGRVPLRERPDLKLDMSDRRMGGGGISILAIGIVVILALALFGLNGRSTESASTPAQTTPLASK